MKTGKYEWWSAGDINAFLGLGLDNMVQLLLMATLLMTVFKFPGDIILKYMIPGSALGIMAGDLAFTYMAFRLARKTGKREVTAMPLGIDTTSLLGLIFAVYGPAFLIFKGQGMDPHAAGMLTWKIGMAITFLIGLFKVVMSFFANWVKRIVPRAGLLGSLAGVALLLIAYIPFSQLFNNPVPGFVSLSIILITLTARIRFRIPGALLAVICGTAAYYIMTSLGLFSPSETISVKLQLGIPYPRLDFITGLKHSLAYLPIAFPFALVVLIGGINVTESAIAVGDDYSPRNIIFIDGCTTILVGLCGGVIQNTPYIGHPAYKEMGGRAGYTLLTALIVGLGGILGVITLFVEYIPEVAVAGILVFIGLEITTQAYHATPKRHAPAVVIACLPAIAYLVRTQMQAAMQAVGAAFKEQSLPRLVEILDTNIETAIAFNSALVFGNGFMLVGLIWGGAVALIISRKLREASCFMFLAAILSLFGAIHSPSLDGSVFLPWRLTLERSVNLGYSISHMPYYLFASYILFGLIILASSKHALHDLQMSENPATP